MLKVCLPAPRTWPLQLLTAMAVKKQLQMAEPPLIRANSDIILRIIDCLDVMDFFAFISVSYIHFFPS